MASVDNDYGDQQNKYAVDSTYENFLKIQINLKTLHFKKLRSIILQYQSW